MAEEKLRKKIAIMEKQLRELQMEADSVKERLQKTESNRDSKESSSARQAPFTSIRLYPNSPRTL